MARTLQIYREIFSQKYGKEDNPRQAVLQYVDRESDFRALLQWTV